MLKKVWQQIDKIILGSVTALFLLGFNLIDSTIGQDVFVKIWVVKLILIISFLIIIIIYSIFSVSKKELISRDIKVFKIDIDRIIKIIYVKPNNQLNLNDIVTIYVDDFGIEKLVGIGFVLNIQKNNSIIQIEMITQPDDKNILELCKNWQNVIVKKEVNYKSLSILIEKSKGDE